MTPGYYDNDSANARLFDGEWLCTGDLVKRDQHGGCWIIGRIKDAVMKGGFTVYLNEVEEAACSIEGVVEAGATRLVRPDGSEDIGLILRLDTAHNMSVELIMSRLESWLGHARLPAGIAITSIALPRTGQGKLDRVGLQQRWTHLLSPT